MDEQKENPAKEKFNSFVEKAMPVLKDKRVWMAVGAVVLLIILISVISSLIGSDNGYIQYENMLLPLENGDETVFVSNAKQLKLNMNAEVKDYSFTMDGKYYAIEDSDGVLYVLNGKKLTKVAEDVKDCTLAVTGKGLLYTVDNDDKTELYHYTVGGKSVLVSDEAIQWIISPDGKTAAYTTYEDEKTNVYYFDGKKSEKISSTYTTLLAMNNGGKYIYGIVYDDDDAFNPTKNLVSLNKKGEKTKIASGLSSTTVYLNYEHTQILFYEDSKTYVSEKAKDAVKISSREIIPVLIGNSIYNYGSGDSIHTAPMKNLYNHIYTDGDGVWLIKENTDKSVKLVSKASNLTLDSTASYLYYVYDNEELRVIKIKDGENASDNAVTIVDDYVSTYAVTSNRSLVYYISDNELHSVNGKNGKNDKTVSKDDVEKYYLYISSKNVAYYIMDGDLYACSNGKKSTKVLTDCDYVFKIGNAVYAYSDGYIYGTSGSKKLNKITEIDDVD